MDVDTEAKLNSASSSQDEKKAVTMLATSNVMAAAGTMPSVTVSLHPLVIMNISEHWTRICAQAKCHKQIYGALIGKQTGRNIEVLDSHELKVDGYGEETSINYDFYFTKEKQYIQLCCELDLIGWYTTGKCPTKKEVEIHKQMCIINEFSLFLQLNPFTGIDNQLSVNFFQSENSVVNGEPTKLFIPLTYKLVAEEAERLIVDNAAKMPTSETSQESTPHLVAQYNALQILLSNIKLILKYIKEVESGNLPINQGVLRDISSMCQSLPLVECSEFRQDYYKQMNDVGIVALLGTLCKGCNDIHNFVNKLNVLYGKTAVEKRNHGTHN